MKITAEVLSVDSHGDALNVKLQGKAKIDADWRPYLKFDLDVPETDKNRRAFYVGRKVKLTIEPV